VGVQEGFLNGEVVFGYRVLESEVVLQVLDVLLPLVFLLGVEPALCGKLLGCKLRIREGREVDRKSRSAKF
jgi:hypothetical protein